MQIPTARLMAILADLIAAGGALETVDLRLWASDVTPNEDTAWADLVECDYTGYSKATAIAWNTPYVDPLGAATVQTACHQFIQTGVTVTNICYGWALTVGAGPVVLWASERFPTPFNFVLTGRSIQQSGRYSLGSGVG